MERSGSFRISGWRGGECCQNSVSVHGRALHAVPGASGQHDKAQSCQLGQGGGGRRQGALEGGTETPARERCRLMRCSSSTVPGVWKSKHFQAAAVLATPAKFLCKERGEQQRCSCSSSINLACLMNLPQCSLLFEVINDVFNNSRGHVCTDLSGKASSTHMPEPPKCKPIRSVFTRLAQTQRRSGKAWEERGERRKRGEKRGEREERREERGEAASTWSPLSLSL